MNILRLSLLRHIWYWESWVADLTCVPGYYDSFLHVALFNCAWSLHKALTPHPFCLPLWLMESSLATDIYSWCSSSASSSQLWECSRSYSLAVLYLTLPHLTQVPCISLSLMWFPLSPCPSSTDSIPLYGLLAVSGKHPISLLGLTPKHTTWNHEKYGKTYTKSPAACPCFRASCFLETLFFRLVCGGLGGICCPES